LDNNQLTGSIPTELESLDRLEYLHLSNNQLTGSIPTELGNLINLKQLILNNNPLTGSIPTELGDLTQLEYLYLGNTQLAGEIPYSIVNLINLTDLTLSCGLTSSDQAVISFIDNIPRLGWDIACPPAPTFTLTLVSTNGTVAKSPDQATYHEGDVVQLTATPNAGWAFVNWTGDLTSSVNPDSVTIHGNTSVTANYTQNEYTLTITSANGTVAKSPDQATYHEGDVVQLTATPYAGWAFVNWTGGLIGTANPGPVTIHGNTSVTANFTQNEYTLAITSAHGTVARNPSQATYHEGDVVQLTATPNAGWTFANWTGGLTSTANPSFVTIHGNTSVTANYTQNAYTIYLPLVIR